MKNKQSTLQDNIKTKQRVSSCLFRMTKKLQRYIHEIKITMFETRIHVLHTYTEPEIYETGTTSQSID